MKTKTVYVATAPVTFYDARGNATVRPVGFQITEKEFKGLNAPRQAKFAAKTVQVGKAAPIQMTVGQIPAEGRIDEDGMWRVNADELHLLKGEVREFAEENLALWTQAFPEIAWPGIKTGVNLQDPEKRLTWYMDRTGLPANLPPMYSTQGVPCKPIPKREQRPGQHIYRTAALKQTTYRLRRGAPVFAYAEAIDRLLAA